MLKLNHTFNLPLTDKLFLYYNSYYNYKCTYIYICICNKLKTNNKFNRKAKIINDLSMLDITAIQVLSGE